MKQRRNIPRILLTAIVILLWASVVQDNLDFAEVDRLNGDITEVPNTSFQFSSWFSGEYQEKKEKYLNANFGFRNLCIRINNQIEFSFYNLANAKEVVVGKQNVLYEKSYIDNYYGKNFKGDNYYFNLLNDLKLISDTLESLNKNLIVVIAPGKSSFYPEFIPNKLKSEKTTSNYDAFLEHSKKYPDLKIINFRPFFNKIKATTPYSLYPKYGIHWSTYGATLACDSILNYIESTRSIKLRKQVATSFKTEESHGVDYDIGDGMNLLFRIGSDTLAYPELEFNAPSGYTKPNLLIIGDSFYWNLYQRMNTSFDKNTFLYYNEAINSNDPNPPQSVTPEYIMQEIMEKDIIMLLVTEAKVESIGWGFINTVAELFKLRSKNNGSEYISENEIQDIIKIINENPGWVDEISKKALERNVSYEQALHDDARWFIEQQKNKKLEILD